VHGGEIGVGLVAALDANTCELVWNTKGNTMETDSMVTATSILDGGLVLFLLKKVEAIRTFESFFSDFINF